METNMTKPPAICCLLVALLTCPVVAQDVAADVRAASTSLFGENVGTVAPKHVSAMLTNLCPDAAFYTATMVVSPDELKDLPTANPPRLFVVLKSGQSFSLVTAKDVCAFIGGLKKPVADELSAYKRALVFAELVGGTIRTAMPKRESIITRYQTQKAEDWPIVIENAESRWNVSFTLMTDPEIEYCIRHTLRVEKDGKTVSIAEERTVYTYTMYE